MLVGPVAASLRRALVDPESADRVILFRTRLPRVLLGAVVGGSLGTSGAALQALLANPLACPHLLGISGGAAVGGVLALIAGAEAISAVAPLAVFVAASLLVGAAVSVSGMISFVGLIVPHLIRLVLGADHRLLLPASFLGGAAFLVWADALARTALAPAELPVGVVTAILGGPFFLFLLRRELTRAAS